MFQYQSAQQNRFWNKNFGQNSLYHIKLLTWPNTALCYKLIYIEYESYMQYYTNSVYEYHDIA